MRRKKLFVAVIVLAVFWLGLLVGRHAGRSPSAPSFASHPKSSGESTGCIDFRGAGAHAGETGCVSGRVLRAFTSKSGNTFLDFCADYHACPFTSVIFSSDKSKFGDLQSLAGRQIEIRGPITTYQGRAEIIIRDPEQIRALP